MEGSNVPYFIALAVVYFVTTRLAKSLSQRWPRYVLLPMTMLLCGFCGALVGFATAGITAEAQYELFVRGMESQGILDADYLRRSSPKNSFGPAVFGAIFGLVSAFFLSAWAGVRTINMTRKQVSHKSE
jgi:hypothetical protein